ncbi:MAG TPA: hypothetical protein VIQ30_24290 [Pseudonocardia sp.]
MPATNAGRDFVAAAILGEATTDFNAANAYIGVGDSSTAFATSQTDLQASSNKLRKGMNATYPSRSVNVLTFQTTFIESEANFAWQEIAVFNAPSGGAMLSRLVQSLGTKPSSELWRATLTLTLGV